MEWSSKGQESLAKAKILHHSALDLFRRSEFDKCIQFLEESLRLRQNALPDAHPQIIATLEFLIHVLSLRRGIEDRLPYLERMLEAKKARFGKFHVETEQAMAQVAEGYERLGLKREAEEINRRIWGIRCMTPAQRQAADFDETFALIPPAPQRTKVPTLAATPQSLQDMFKPNFRSSKFVDSNEWMERLQILMKTKPEERDALRSRWDGEERDRNMQKLFSTDFSSALTDSDGVNIPDAGVADEASKNDE